MNNHRLWVHFSMILPPLFWAGNAVLGRFMADALPPFAFSFWRWLIASLILSPFALQGLYKYRAIIRQELPVLFLCAITSVSAYNSLLYLALQSTTAINATLVGASLPAMIPVIVWIWLGERFSLKQGIGMLVSLGGVLLTISSGDIFLLLRLELRQGDVLMLIATLAWAFYSVLLRKKPTKLPILVFLAFISWIGMPFIFPLYAWEMGNGKFIAFNLANSLAIFYVGLFPSVLAYIFWNKGIEKLGPTTAGHYYYLVPVLAAFLAVLLLDEPLRWFHPTALLLILLGITIANRRSK